MIPLVAVWIVGALLLLVAVVLGLSARDMISTKGEQQLLKESQGGRWLSGGVATVTGMAGFVLVMVDLLS